MKQKEIMKNWTKETHYKRAIELQKRNPATFWILKWLRKKLTVRAVADYVREHMDSPIVSSTNVQKIKTDCESLIKDNYLFREFMIASWYDPEQQRGLEQKRTEKKADKKRWKNQKEKNNKLEEEMDEAKIILEEMDNPNLTGAKKWELVGKWKRQAESITKSIQEWGLPKVWWVTALYDINGKLLAKGKEMILKALWTLDPSNYKELKALSDILDTAFKQNRLIEWKSTENVAVWVSEIYDKIIENADKNKNGNTNSK